MIFSFFLYFKVLLNIYYLISHVIVDTAQETRYVNVQYYQ